jgi:hypothetical protein
MKRALFCSMIGWLAVISSGCVGTDSTAPPAQDAAPSPAPTERAPRDHDEPIVVDNRPIQIRLGRNPAEMDDAGQQTFSWVREFTAFGYLAVIVRKNNGDIDGEPVIKELCEDCDLQLELTSIGSGTQRSTVTFDADLRAGTLTMKTGARKFNKDGKWFKPAEMEQHGGPPMRVLAITGREANNNELGIPEFTEENRKVEILITGRAH